MSRAISWVVLSLGYLVLLLSTQVAFGAEKGLKTFQIQSGDRDRKYMVYQPPSYTADGQAAVVFALHGGGGHMEIQAEDKYYRFRSTADRHGFLVVFPNGSSRFPRSRLATWNAGVSAGKYDLDFSHPLAPRRAGALSRWQRKRSCACRCCDGI